MKLSKSNDGLVGYISNKKLHFIADGISICSEIDKFKSVYVSEDYSTAVIEEEINGYSSRLYKYNIKTHTKQLITDKLRHETKREGMDGDMFYVDKNCERFFITETDDSLYYVDGTGKYKICENVFDFYTDEDCKRVVYQTDISTYDREWDYCYSYYYCDMKRPPILIGKNILYGYRGQKFEVLYYQKLDGLYRFDAENNNNIKLTSKNCGQVKADEKGNAYIRIKSERTKVYTYDDLVYDDCKNFNEQYNINNRERLKSKNYIFGFCDLYYYDGTMHKIAENVSSTLFPVDNGRYIFGVKRKGKKVKLSEIIKDTQRIVENNEFYSLRKTETEDLYLCNEKNKPVFIAKNVHTTSMGFIYYEHFYFNKKDNCIYFMTEEEKETVLKKISVKTGDTKTIAGNVEFANIKPNGVLAYRTKDKRSFYDDFEIGNIGESDLTVECLDSGSVYFTEKNKGHIFFECYKDGRVTIITDNLRKEYLYEVLSDKEVYYIANDNALYRTDYLFSNTVKIADDVSSIRIFRQKPRIPLFISL